MILTCDIVPLNTECNYSHLSLFSRESGLVMWGNNYVKFFSYVLDYIYCVVIFSKENIASRRIEIGSHNY